ncbi:MAG: GNAT family N-acetyltransferase [Oscillospiraceae bacterium]|nr:GNAT family N-acetyltransferase [Oscillospiraceae bacterium]
MTFEDMDISRVREYAELFVSVFNRPPWNDRWTALTAKLRIGELITTGTFVGKAAYEDGRLLGIILGQKEHFFDGVRFQIQEFCVRPEYQQSGCGSRLLSALRDELNAIGVTKVYLITSRGESTEGWYRRRGLKTSDEMIVMSESLGQ